MKRADDYLNSRGEVYFRFTAPHDKIEELTRIISIDKVKDDTVYAYANRKGFSSFSMLNIPFEVLSPPSFQDQVKMAQSPAGLKDWDFYPSYTAYLDLMTSFATNHPDLCSIHEIGTSIEGRKMLFAKISDNVTEKEAEPEFMFTSTMHGDEVTGYILCLRLIDYLLNNYETDPLVNRLVDSVEIWINPLANPDGTYFGGNNSVAGATRYNANFVDLNRNFPDPEDGQHPDGEPWQAETEVMMDFMKEHNFTFSANYHGGAEVMNYPWDTWFKRHPDDAWFQHVSLNYADTVKKYGGSDYFSDISENGITNGYDWYTISGGRQDYMTYYRHGREITIEVSENKMPPAANLPSYWDYNHAAMLHYIENCLYGIHGIITDSATHDPIRGHLEVVVLDADSSQVYSDSINGNYHRMIEPGTYDLKFSASGYKDKLFEGILADNYTSQVWLNVELAANNSRPEALPDKGPEIFQYRIDQNLNLFIDLPESSNLDISIIDLNGIIIYRTSKFQTSGQNRIQLPYYEIASGIYFCRISWNGKTQTIKFSRL